ncbi:MAG TPA: cytochrome c biogenesis protein CcsA [Verrucomicrobiae bacterium]|nr:cytochrome c biogenesis protein CcsA [Verrucomicrobiae bacterium]
MSKAPSENRKPGTPPAKIAAPAQTGWRRWAPWAIVTIFALWILGSMRPVAPKTVFNVDEFGRLPAVLEGRIQPLDSVARNTLLVMRSKQTLAVEEGGKTTRMSAIEWLLEVMTRPEEADKRKLFRIDHPEVKSMLKVPEEEKHFSYEQIQPQMQELAKEAKRIQGDETAENPGVKPELQTTFEKAVVRAHFAALTYVRLKNSLQPEGTKDFAAEVAKFESTLPAGLAAVEKQRKGEAYDEKELAPLVRYFREYEDLSKWAYPFIVPPTDPANKDGWRNIGASLMESMPKGAVHPAAVAYAQMASAYANNQPDKFNKAVSDYKEFLKTNFAHTLTKGSRESFFNHYAPFIKSMTVYIVAFLFACAFWFIWSDWLRLTALRLALLALIVHSTGLIFRMYLEGRPPVTNLYSSAIFVGWGAVVLGLVLERVFRDGIGVVVSTLIGFVTLVVAHNLSLDGDTLKVLVAVLDTNIWLATHVVVITLGYSSMFLAGILALVYIVRGVFSKNLSVASAKNLTRAAYGIVCFATLFSFVGTVLGGIWADQSWGRFWGWDPKENGALLIVLWCAVLLHARWGGMVRERGFMAMCIFGNIVTSFSWFGVNMLGVGLHSYGFMDQAFKWLMGFIGSQILLIAIAMLPRNYWRSGIFNPASKSTPKTKEITPEGEFAAAQKMLPQNPAN